jgi:hypothetical protein
MVPRLPHQRAQLLSGRRGADQVQSASELGIGASVAIRVKMTVAAQWAVLARTQLGHISGPPAGPTQLEHQPRVISGDSL